MWRVEKVGEIKNVNRWYIKYSGVGEYLASCRKYRISISVIFQNYSQIVEVYGKEESNSIIGNCDTTIFLGGSDADTLKVVCDRLGKETVKTLTFGNSKGRFGSVSINKQEVGRGIILRVIDKKKVQMMSQYHLVYRELSYICGMR